MLFDLIMSFINYLEEHEWANILFISVISALTSLWVNTVLN